ncbi:MULTISPECIES: histidine phosphatase family protein [unclassified Paenibacillus]|uniref:histidine phosphatase family protein n=1 Tax=unclassified Paenibacillus TaxID=185978 RepID=UPI001AE12600|nr:MULTISPECIES: histidine phosphatase family protein [unclassified Paenibacillus]MBP1155279.1 putative phosphoglycerate mutase [Paenibacillus sp. PvP091]MBP1169337.1 putative phosphoglycerate mutase [Paenibacillus sp. PvR098]MBP2440365.1 putative phosphoglycerate mutase [Paenibacillus sp. PvP052]
MITLGLVRHGTTEWNLAGRMQGQMDTPLAEVGRMQARLLAERLQGEDWDGIISSDLIRARETAQTLADMTGTPFIGVDSRLRERAFGQLEGTTLEDRLSRWGENWRGLDLGLETDEGLLTRWQAFLLDTERDHRGKRILIVSHGGYIAPVLALYLGRTIEEHLKNTSLTVIEQVEEEVWHCRLLNCTSHLAKLEEQQSQGV